MATTTNYGWTTPDDTALVKDGAAAIRTLGSSVDTTTKNLNPETTLGDISYRSSTANVKTRLALGTANQQLRVNSGATAPEWFTPAGSGGMTLISETVASANSSIDFTSISGSYKQLMLVWNGIYHSATGSQFSIRFNSDSGANYEDSWLGQNPTTGQVFKGVSGTNTYIMSAQSASSCFGYSVDNVELNYSVGWLLIDNYASTSKFKNYNGNWNGQESGIGMWTIYQDLGVYTSTSAITSLNIVRVSGSATMSNVANTSVRLYGIS